MERPFYGMGWVCHAVERANEAKCPARDSVVSGIEVKCLVTDSVDSGNEVKCLATVRVILAFRTLCWEQPTRLRI